MRPAWVFSRTTSGPSPRTSSEPILVVGTPSPIWSATSVPSPLIRAASGHASRRPRQAGVLPLPRRVCRLLAALRSRASSLVTATSSAAYGSAAAASARTTGPRVFSVISTRSLRSACRGLSSLDTSTSRLITLPSSFWILSSFSATCFRNRSGTSVLRPLTTMSTQNSVPGSPPRAGTIPFLRPVRVPSPSGRCVGCRSAVRGFRYREAAAFTSFCPTGKINTPGVCFPLPRT